jgi:hypothetical protein
MILREGTDPGDKSYVFLRGNPISRGEQVEPAFLSVLSGDAPVNFPAGERRLGLARAIVDESNSLTRRVIVNWVWQHHFGQGLVRTPDDFGTRGDPPTHPELLDYLAEKFLEDGWSMKALHRRIMLSRTWQQDSVINAQASHVDPENRLLWRMPVRKLDMEAMRDSLLAVSGELDRKAGGQPFEEKGGKAIPRRSVYAFVNRDVISKMASTFDGADPSACTVKRPATMVPQQTLFALNSDYIQNRATALAQLPEIQSAGDDRVSRLYQRIFARLPDEEEIKFAEEFFSQVENPDTALPQFVHALLASNEFHFID